MKTSKIVVHTIAISVALSALACSKQVPEPNAPAAPAPEPAAQPESALATPNDDSESYFVEGVAGGVMVRKIQLEAEVVSVDREKREAVLRGPHGNQVTVKVGKDAVNFYQVAAGDRVNVLMARELVVYVADDKAKEAAPDGTAVAGARAAEGERPAGAIVASTKVTAKIKALDIQARTATLSLETGEEDTFSVRPDVDMTQYKVGQDVVFLITDLLALEVKKV